MEKYYNFILKLEPVQESSNPKVPSYWKIMVGLMHDSNSLPVRFPLCTLPDLSAKV